MSMKIKGGWGLMFDFLQSRPYNGKLSKLGKVFGIGNNIAPALYQMGIIQQTPEGWRIPPNVRQTGKMWDRVKELYPLTKEERERRIAATPSRISVAEKEAAFELELDRIAPPAPTLRQDCAEIPHGEIIGIAERLAGAGYNVEISRPDGSFFFKIQR